MRLFRRQEQRTGLTGIGVRPDGVCVAQVRRGSAGRPAVPVFEFRPWDSTAPRDRKVLGKLTAEHGLKRAACTTVLASDEYKLLLVDAPGVNADEMRAAVRWRIKDMVDFNVSDAVVDVFDVPGTAASGGNRPLYATVAQKQVIQQRIDWMEGSGVNLRVIDIPELAQRNIAALLPQDADGVVMLSLHDSGGLITVTKNAQLFFSRSLDAGLDAFRQSAQPAGFFDRIVLEIQRSIDYCDSHFRNVSLGHLAVAPLPAEAAGLAAHLGANLSIGVLPLDLATVLDFAGEPSVELQCKGLMTLGAALRQEAA